MKQLLLLSLVGYLLLSGCTSFDSPHDSRNIDPSHDKYTIGHLILELESEVPGRSDGAPELDRILNMLVSAIATSEATQIFVEERRALTIFGVIANTLRLQGYHFNYSYPKSLTEILTSDHHYFDCDTGSFIYLSVAELMNLPISMVEVEVSGNPGEREFGDHNYVRWSLQNGGTVNWDVNGEYRRTGDEETGQYGFAWTDRQLHGYIYFARAIAWRDLDMYTEAIRDYELAIRQFPQWAKAKNNLAWLLVTVEEVQELGRIDDALQLAKAAVELHPSPNNRDTLACAFALSGDYSEAVRIQREVVDEMSSDDYRDRLKRFENCLTCLGQD